MKVQITRHGRRIEGLGAHSGYRIRLATTEPAAGASWPLTVCVRGSESEDEVHVPLPPHALPSLEAAFDWGFDEAQRYIDAMDRRLGRP